MDVITNVFRYSGEVIVDGVKRVEEKVIEETMLGNDILFSTVKYYDDKGKIIKTMVYNSDLEVLYDSVYDD